VSGLDLSLLSSGDAVVALRTYPRRYRNSLAPLPDDPDAVDALAHRIGPAGASAIHLLTDTVRTIEVLGQALHQIVYSDDAVLHPGVTDPQQRQWEQPVVGTVADGMAELTDAANDLAEAADKVSGKGWRRQGVVAGTGQQVAAIDVLREAVRTAADNLTSIDATLRAARS